MRRRSPIWVYISTNVENAASLTLAVGSESKLTIEARNFVTVKLWAPYLKTFEKFSRAVCIITDIAKKYLISKQYEQNGIKKKELMINTAAIRDMIRYYTREAGVRGLERQLAKILRKVVKERLLAKKSPTKPTAITNKNLEKFSGVKKFK